VNVRWFALLITIKEKTKRSNFENGWHDLILLQFQKGVLETANGLTQPMPEERQRRRQSAGVIGYTAM